MSYLPRVQSSLPGSLQRSNLFITRLSQKSINCWIKLLSDQIWLTLCSPWSARPGCSYSVPLSKQPSEKASTLSIHVAYQTSLKNERRVEATALLQHEAVREWMSWMSLLSLPLANYWNHLCYRGCFISTICTFHRRFVRGQTRKNMTNSCNSCTGAVLYLCISWSLNSASNCFFGNASKRPENEAFWGITAATPRCCFTCSMAMFKTRCQDRFRQRPTDDLACQEKTIETDASKSRGKRRVLLWWWKSHGFGMICWIGAAKNHTKTMAKYYMPLHSHGAVGLDEMSAL